MRGIRTASRSFGPHVAKLAGVPLHIVERAIGISEDFEQAASARQKRLRSNERLSLCLQADAAWLINKAKNVSAGEATTRDRLLIFNGMRRHVRHGQSQLLPQ